MSSTFRRAIDGINQLTAVICVSLLTALIVISALQVFFRYILEEPMIWSEEAARYLLIWLSFAAGGLVMSSDGHPRVEVLSSILSKRVQALIDLAVQALIFFFLVVFVYVSADLAQRYIAFNSLGTGLSQSVPRYALPVGGFLMMINLLPRMGATFETMLRPGGEH